MLQRFLHTVRRVSSENKEKIMTINSFKEEELQKYPCWLVIWPMNKLSSKCLLREQWLPYQPIRLVQWNSLLVILAQFYFFLHHSIFFLLFPIDVQFSLALSLLFHTTGFKSFFVICCLSHPVSHTLSHCLYHFSSADDIVNLFWNLTAFSFYKIFLFYSLSLYILPITSTLLSLFFWNTFPPSLPTYLPIYISIYPISKIKYFFIYFSLHQYYPFPTSL